jgi:hypothetical protein
LRCRVSRSRALRVAFGDHGVAAVTLDIEPRAAPTKSRLQRENVGRVGLCGVGAWEFVEQGAQNFFVGLADGGVGEFGEDFEAFGDFEGG